MYKTSEYQTPDKYPFPGENVSPEVKASKEYQLAFSEAYYSAYLRNKLSCGPLYKSRPDMIKRRLYATGQQDETQYMKMFLGHNVDLEQARKGYMAVNWKVFNVSSKFRLNLIGKYMGLDYSVDLASRNLDVIDEKREKLWMAYTKQRVKAAMQDVPGADALQEGVQPQTLKELQNLEKMGAFNHKVEFAYQEFIEAILAEGWDTEMIIDMLSDIYCENMTCAWDYVDSETGIMKVKHVDYINCGYRLSDKNEVIDGFYLEMMTISDLRTTGAFTEKELMEIAKQACGSLGNPWQWNYSFEYWKKPNEMGNCPWDDYRVLVMHSEQCTTDKYYYSQNLNKPNKPVRREAYGYESKNKNRDTVVKERRNYYQNKWIVGTKFNWGYGPQENAPRPKLSDARCSLHVWQFDDQSLVQQCEPVFDQVHIDWTKYQNAKMTANNHGYAIDESILEGTEIAQKLKPAQQIRMFRRTGTLLYRTMDGRGRNTMSPNAPPIVEMKGGAMDAVNEFIMSYNAMQQILMDKTGISGPSIGKPVDGKAVNEIQLASTDTTLSPLIDGIRQIKKSLAKNILLRGQLLLKYSQPSIDYYTGVLGTDVMAVLKMSLDKNWREFGLQIKVYNNSSIMQELKAGAAQALAAGRNGQPGLEWIEFAQISLLIQQGASPEYIIAVIGRITEDRKKEAAMVAQNNAKAQAEGQAQMQAAIIQMQKDLDDHKSKNILATKVGERAIDHYFTTKENKDQAITEGETMFAGTMLESLVGPLLQSVTQSVQPQQQQQAAA